MVFHCPGDKGAANFNGLRKNTKNNGVQRTESSLQAIWRKNGKSNGKAGLNT